MCYNLTWEKPSDKLPKTRERIIVAVKMTIGQNIWRTVAEYIPKFSVLAEDYLSEDCDPDFCDIGEDGKEYTPEGWYESLLEPETGLMIDGEVMYWIKLPAIPLI